MRRRLFGGSGASWLAAVLALVAGACGAADRVPETETRTFEVLYLEDWVVESLVQPYVYEGREGAPGMASIVEGKLTVRETPENLRRIEETLLEFDHPKPIVRLAFQIIEANGETEVDPRIADVENVLRELFRFEGYRLLEEVLVHGAEGSQVFQEFDSEELGRAAIEATIRNVRTDASGGSVQLEIRFHAGERTVLGTTVRVRAGQTAVLGRTPSSVGSRNIILVVHPELEDI
jgi:hypothetical protein